MNLARCRIGLMSLGLALVALTATTSLAVIHPSAITERAPEKVSLHVLAVSLKHTGPTDQPVATDVHLVGRVLHVRETATSLRQGDAILVRYVQDHAQREARQREMERKAKEGWAGPQVMYPPPPPRVGQRTMAYLEKSDDMMVTGSVYRPGAHQYSFDTLPVSPAVHLTAADDGKTIDLPLGNLLIITIDTKRANGWGNEWELAELSDPTVLLETGRSFEKYEAQDATSIVGRAVWIFEASRPGTARLTLRYGRSWEDLDRSTQKFAVEVKVE